MNSLVSYLFQTNAIKICPENKPFWYTSGKIGPYFINTHFLYGSEEQASDLLHFIDSISDHLELPNKVFEKVLKQYEKNTIYHDVINQMKNYIETHLDLTKIDYISGGERRDWFFSNILAYLLKKPHITIYKNLDCVISNPDFSSTKTAENLEGKEVLHIADITTEGSSYIRAWIPAIKKVNGFLAYSVVVIDRMQGGSTKLKEANIEPYSLVQVDPTLFKEAYQLKVISENQLDLLNQFFENPDKTMQKFLKDHPDFIENSLKADEKTANRVKLCLENHFYEL